MPALTTKTGLRVGGITPFTATDFPGQLATVVFVQGCPWRCGYCHNPHLQSRAQQAGSASWDKVLTLLQRRRGLIDAVVFSGGEPTIDPQLLSAITEVRAMGYKVGLHCGGIYPERLKTVLPLLDWVGFDVKARFQDYAGVTRIQNSGDPAYSSLKIVLEHDVPYECRTTIHPALLSEAQIRQLSQELITMGVKNYALQVFRTQGCNDAMLNAAVVANYPSPELILELKDRFAHFTLRTA